MALVLLLLSIFIFSPVKALAFSFQNDSSVTVDLRFLSGGGNAVDSSTNGITCSMQGSAAWLTNSYRGYGISFPALNNATLMDCGVDPASLVYGAGDRTDFIAAKLSTTNFYYSGQWIYMYGFEDAAGHRFSATFNSASPWHPAFDGSSGQVINFNNLTIPNQGPWVLVQRYVASTNILTDFIITPSTYQFQSQTPGTSLNTTKGGEHFSIGSYYTGGKGPGDGAEAYCFRQYKAALSNQDIEKRARWFLGQIGYGN